MSPARTPTRNALLDALRREGIEAEHIITLGLRDVADVEIRQRLDQGDLLFLTQDTEFIMASTSSLKGLRVYAADRALMAQMARCARLSAPS